MACIPGTLETSPHQSGSTTICSPSTQHTLGCDTQTLPQPRKIRLAIKEDGNISFVYHLRTPDLQNATLYIKEPTELLTFIGDQHTIPAEAKHVVLDFNPTDDTLEEQNLWLWGNKWLEDLEWDPREWNWRRIGILPESSVLNYSTKRGYRVALRQDNHQAPG